MLDNGYEGIRFAVMQQALEDLTKAYQKNNLSEIRKLKIFYEKYSFGWTGLDGKEIYKKIIENLKNEERSNKG